MTVIETEPATERVFADRSGSHAHAERGRRARIRRLYRAIAACPVHELTTATDVQIDSVMP